MFFILLCTLNFVFQNVYVRNSEDDDVKDIKDQYNGITQPAIVPILKEDTMSQ
jgi:hypothetical protein